MTVLMILKLISFPATSTTTTTTTTTTPKPTTTSTTTTTSSTTTKSPKRKRSVTGDFEWNVKALVESGSVKPENVAYENMTDAPLTTTTPMPMEQRIKMLQDNQIPYFGVCTNDSKVITDPKKIYGYYQRTIQVENPVGNVTVSNNVWLRHGDMCQLLIKFGGTAPFDYCTKSIDNDNSTNVEKDDGTCRGWRTIETKEINYEHFFPKASNSYSLVVFIRNEVSVVRTTIGVQFYDGEFSSLLSYTF